MKKCQGEHKESAWLQLRPLLLNKINKANVFEVNVLLFFFFLRPSTHYKSVYILIFQALCKVAPFYDNLVLLLCLNRIFNSKNLEAEKVAIFKKIFASRFGEHNPHIQEINNLLASEF